MLHQSITTPTSVNGERVTMNRIYLWLVPGITKSIGLSTRMRAEIPM